MGFLPGLAKLKAPEDFTIGCNAAMLVCNLRAEGLIYVKLQ